MGNFVRHHPLEHEGLRTVNMDRATDHPAVCGANIGMPASPLDGSARRRALVFAAGIKINTTFGFPPYADFAEPLAQLSRTGTFGRPQHCLGQAVRMLVPQPEVDRLGHPPAVLLLQMPHFNAWL